MLIYITLEMMLAEDMPPMEVDIREFLNRLEKEL